MGRCRAEASNISRRQFLKDTRLTWPLFLPAPLRCGCAPFALTGAARLLGEEAVADFRLSPDYPSRSPLEDMLRLVEAGADGYTTEVFAEELRGIFGKLGAKLRGDRLAGADFAALLNTGVESTSLRSPKETPIPTNAVIELRRRSYSGETRVGADDFVAELLAYFSTLGKIETAEFDIVGLKQLAGVSPMEVDAEVRYALVGSRTDRRREERIGTWRMRWRQNAARDWTATRWFFAGETVASAIPLFTDITGQTLGQTESYREQLSHGVGHWRTVLDAASGIDVYGNNGLALGDFDGDGHDDLYICQPSGLPNRLYRNRGDGTFEDVTGKAGVGVLDATASAIFADFENRGRQDLLVVTASGPLLFQNRGGGTFALKPDAFSFATPPAGTFTHAAVADYDRDGRLDVYFCLYSYYLGLDQYHYPSPYFDARNGPPNFLMHNEGGGKFVDRTTAAGLNAENDRFSFACAWGDISGSAGPDLYVANDFGRNNLYRNNGDGTFAVVSEESGANVPGAGMSVCWCDFDNDGGQDLYVSNMWAAAGQRVSEDDRFHSQDSAQIRSYYRGHARGNSLYRNQHGKFENVAERAGAAMGRWAWSSDGWDFDHDGYSDLYVANGYISGSESPELSSFFWRQVVGNSPASSTPSANYERGWNAINELIRADHTWNGYERNTVYLNNRNGTFSEISGVSGLDFLEDSRSFGLGDLDGDGRMEMVLKNRNAPQVRVLRNQMSGIGDSVCFRLRGAKSNRDAIGASVTVEGNGLRQTKYLQAGTGFLSQHSKELFFGLGKNAGKISVAIRWPSGLQEAFADVPANRRVTIEEGAGQFSAVPFASRAVAVNAMLTPPGPTSQPEKTPVATWLLDPLPAPDFSLPDLAGQAQTLSTFRGRPVLLNFWAEASPLSIQQLESLQRGHREMTAKGVHIVCVNLDKNADATKILGLLTRNHLTLGTLLATPDVAGVYNIIYRYLFDRRRDLPIPCSFLLEESGLIVKVYQGLLDLKQCLYDAAVIPRTYEARLGKALPFPGTLHNGRFARNDFTYGVALFQHGYLDQAADSFRQVIATKPDDPEAYYNLGTLFLRKNDLAQAQRYLEQTVKLRPEYPEAWNNLGMIAGQQNRPDEAIRNFKQSLEQRPDYVTPLLNLGNVYRRQGNIPEAERLLNRAIELEPQNAEANYSLGMLYTRQGDLARSVALLQKAVELRPEYPDAINNLGVLYVRQGKNAQAEQEFAKCISVAPNFDQAYLNLARLYVLQQEKEKARDTLQTLLKLQPQHKLAQQALEMLN